MSEIEVFRTYMETEKNSCLMRAETLVKDSRQDEANMEKIRANVFDIFNTVSGAAVMRFPENAKSFLLNKMETIPQAWETSKATAQEHGDYTKALIEEIKLQAISEIKEKFFSIWSENR